MRLKDLSTTTNDVFNLPVDKITVDETFNVRLDTPEVRAHIEMLRDSILQSGFLRTRPLTIRQSDDQTMAIITDGHCRFAAVRMAIAAGAEIKTLPCLSEGARKVGLAERALMLLTSNNGLPLSPLEQAEVIKRLLSYGWSEADIGAKIGRSRQHIANLLELAAAPSDVKVMVVSGLVSSTEAVKTIRRDGANAVATLQAAEAAARAAGRTRITPRFIPAGKSGLAVARRPMVDGHDGVEQPMPRVLQVVRVPLATAAEHVVEMAKGVDLPDDLRRAIDALHESLS